MLITLGYQTVEVGDAQEAERQLTEGETFDLIVTDHLMPGMTGADLELAVRDPWPNIAVLIVSGYADVEGISPELQRLSKPFREKELAQAVSLALQS